MGQLDDFLDAKPATSSGKGIGRIDSFLGPEPPTLSGEFGKGITAGIKGAQQGLYGLTSMAGRAVGSDTVEKWGAEGVQRKEAEMQQDPLAVGDLRDIGGVKDAALWAAGGLGQLAPFAATSAVTGGVGGIVGGAAAKGAGMAAARQAVGEVAKRSVIQKAVQTGAQRGAIAGAGLNTTGMETGSIYADQLTEGQTPDPTKALAYGIPAGILDVLPQARVIGKVLGNGGPKVGVIRDVLTQMGMEGSTEAAQTVLERMGANKLPFSEEGIWEAINAGAVGALGGGVIGGAGRAYQAVRPQAVEPQSTPLPDQGATVAPLQPGTGVIQPNLPEAGQAPPVTTTPVEAPSTPPIQRDESGASVHPYDAAALNAALQPNAGPLAQAAAVATIPVSADAPSATEQARLNESLAGATRETEVQRRKAESELEAADARVQEQAQKQSEVQRRTMLDAILENPEVRNPVGAYAAELKRAGFQGEFALPTKEELGVIKRRADVQAAIEAEQIQEAAPEGTPNEMAVADLVKEKKPAGVPPARATVAKLPDDLLPAAIAAKALGKDGPSAFHAAVKKYTKDEAQRMQLRAAFKAFVPPSAETTQPAARPKQAATSTRPAPSAQPAPTPAPDVSPPSPASKPASPVVSPSPTPKTVLKTPSVPQGAPDVQAQPQPLPGEVPGSLAVAPGRGNVEPAAPAAGGTEPVNPDAGGSIAPAGNVPAAGTGKAADVAVGTIDTAAHESAASPKNDLPVPTEAQREAGNFKMGHATVAGLPITIEHPEGTSRKPGWQKLKAHYGYVKRTTGADKENFDVFVKPGTPENYDGPVFVVDQTDKDGKFDEHKGLIGYQNMMQARIGYAQNYPKDFKVGQITQMSSDEFKGWLANGDTSKPLATVPAPAAPPAAKSTAVHDARGVLAQSKGQLNAMQLRILRAAINEGAKVENGTAPLTPEYTKKLRKIADSVAAFKPAAGDAVRALADHVDSVRPKTAMEQNRAAKEQAKAEKKAKFVPAAETPSTTETPKRSMAEMRTAVREFERTTFNELSADHNLIGKTHAEIMEVVAKRTPPGVFLGAEKGDKLAKAIVEKLAKNAKELEKQKHRDPAVRQAAIDAARETDNIGDDPQMVGNFIGGFDHALAGKTKSTLVGDQINVRQHGYEAARKWIKTEEGAAWFEGRPVSKLQNTGVDLRRHWELLRAQMKAGESDVKKAWAQIERATARADLFAPLLPDGVTPGYQLYIEQARGSIKTFKDWLFGRNNRWYGSSAWGRKSGKAAENLGYVLDGKRHPGSMDETDRQRFESDPAFRITWLQDKADEYLKLARGFIETFDKTSSVAEAAQRFSNKYMESPKALGSGYVPKYQWNDAGADLNSKIGDNNLEQLRVTSLWTEHLIEREATIALPKRADPLTPPKLDRVTREGMKDARKGENVTPAQFKETFGFADVGFGKWVNSKQDQDHLNYAYDALMDLAQHFGTDPKNIGLGGKLHFTIGALGHGKFSAHFSYAHPGPNGTVQVINLTNTRGDGTVYHEWLHALDYNLGGEWGAEYKPRSGKVRDAFLNILKHGVRTPEGVEQRARDFLFGGWYFKGDKNADKVDAAVQGLRYDDRRRTTAYKTNADKLGVDYWGNNEELIARAGEAWAADTLGGTDTYLVNPGWVGDGAATKEKGYRGTPYPTGEERKTFNDAYSALAKAVKWEDGKPTITLADFQKNLPAHFADGDRRRAELSDPANMKAFRDDEAAKRQQAQSEKDALAAEKLRQEQEEMDRLAAAIVDGDNAGDVQGPLTESDLSALWDEAAAELREEGAEKPNAPEPGSPPKSTAATFIAGGRGAVLPEAPVSPTATALIADAAKLGVKGIDEALKGLTALFGGAGKLNSFPGGFDEKTYQAAKPHFEESLRAFQAAGASLKDLFKMLMARFGDGFKEYGIRFAQDMKLTTQLGADTTPSMLIAETVQRELGGRRAFDWRRLFEWADKAYGGTQAEGKYTVKDAYDAMEAGVNRYIIDSHIDPAVSRETALLYVKMLEEITALLPTQSKRTAEMDEFQQFSTVPPFAYVANWVAQVKSDDVFLEPSAGIGGLAAFAHNAGAKLILNELSSRRAAVLQEVFPAARVFHENAEQLHNILPADAIPTVIVMNPPFSASAGRLNTNNTMIGAQHVEQGLKRLAPGGRLVAIVGKGMAMDQPRFKAWWKQIGEKYDVRAVVPVDGSGYAKYGTTFDNALLVIDKIPPSGRPIVTTAAKAYSDLIGILAGVANERPAAAVPTSGSEQVERDTAESERAPTVPASEGDTGAGPTAGVAGPVGGDGTGGRPGVGAGGGGSGRPGGSGKPAKSVRQPRAGAGVGDDTTGSGELDTVDAGGFDSAGVRDPVETKHAELTDSVFESYEPQRLKVVGAQPHPGPLEESAAMSSVQPPTPTYRPNLPKETITEGKLSLAQLEAVVYAGQAHAEQLPNGERRGYFIGDGTGVGKGREIAGIIMDNMRQGRKKAVWISEKQGLMNDAKRDLKGAGGDESLIFNQNKTSGDEAIKTKNGVLFTTYSTLRSPTVTQATDLQSIALNGVGTGPAGKGSRLDQLVNWLGADFDGVLVFDEAHNAGNALAIKGERGSTKPSAQALTVIDLQKKIPNARIVYVSATGATQVSNFAYATRLGLWGDGTSFPSVHQFIAQMTSGGLATMELVARDLKQLGAYISRSLSFRGVTYGRVEHQLSELQRDIYNKLADAWQITLNHMEQALEDTGAVENGVTRNADAKKAMRAAYWGTQQRFFNQIITSMQMPSAVEQIERDIANGDAVVLQLVNTNESQQKRALAKRSEDESDDLEELDLTPRDQLLDMVRKAFPVQQQESYVDENGNKRSRPVTDSKGEPVLNADAVAAREALLKDLEDIRVPDGPLEIILNHFGPDVVGEVTGRTTRVVRKPNKDGEITAQIEKRGPPAARADADAFMADKKRILLFSDAGGTGFSFHADLTQKNQRKRKHYLVQPGWRADKAVQGFGRSHRTNQKQPPHYWLVTTDIPAQKRFLSSIARRLDQLGALTKGQRDASGQSMFSEKDNLESVYATRAVRSLMQSVQAGQVEGLQFRPFLHQLGLDDIIGDNGQIPENKYPPTRQFLNRLLSLRIDMQGTVFDAFAAMMEEQVDLAAQRGELETGMQTLRGLSSRVVQDDVVHTDKRTGAVTRFVQVEMTMPTVFHDFPTEKKAGGKIEWVMNQTSGRVWGKVKSGTKTTRSGAIIDRYRMMGTSGIQLKDAEELARGEYDPLTDKQAAAAWAAENARRKPTYTKDVHMVVGAILPIWDRLKTDATIEVARTQTSDGQRLLGRVIRHADVDDVRARLSIAAPEAKLPATEILKRILKGDIATLANGWTIERAKVSDDLRAELKMGYAGSPWGTHPPVGIMHERIAWNDRYFIENNKDGTDQLAKILESKPVVKLGKPGAAQDESLGNRNAGTIRPGQSLDRHLYSMVNSGATAPELLHAIATQSKTPLNRAIAHLLIRAKINPTVIMGAIDPSYKFATGNDHGYSASYVPDKDLVTLHSFSKVETDLIHEFMHSATVAAIRRGGMAAGQMKALFKHVEKFIADHPELQGQYGMERIEEFVSEAFSNPKFQAMLKGIPARAGGPIQSAWQWFANIVRSILGLHQSQSNAFLQALEIGGALVEENMAAKGVGGSAFANRSQGPRLSDWTEGDGRPGYGLHIADATNAAGITKNGLRAAPDGYVYLWQNGLDADSDRIMREARQTRGGMGWDEAGEVPDAYYAVNLKALGDRVEPDPYTGELRVKGDIPASAIIELRENEAFGNAAAGRDPTGTFSPYKDAAINAVHDVFTNNKTFSLGKLGMVPGLATPRQKAFVDPENFGPVHTAVQSYLLNVSKFALRAANLAPDVLPQITSVHDAIKAIGKLANRKQRKADSQALQETLNRERELEKRMTDDELAHLTDHQRGMVAQAHDALDKSMHDLNAASIARALHGKRMDAAVSEMVESGDVGPLLDTLKTRIENTEDPQDKADMQEIFKTASERTRKIENLIAKGYVPHLRYGDWAVDVLEPNGNRRSFNFFESQRQANAAVRMFKEQYGDGYTVTISKVAKESPTLFEGVSPDVLELFVDQLAERGLVDPTAGAYQEFLKNVIANNSAMKRLIQSRDVPGYDTDIQRVLATFTTANARMAAILTNGPGIVQAIGNIDKKTHGESYDEAIKLRDYILNPTEEFAKLRSYLFMNYLGGSVASAMVNMTQPVLTTFPRLSEFAGAKAVAYIKDGARIATARIYHGTATLTGELRTAIERGEREGLLLPQEMHQLYAESIKGLGSGVGMRATMQLMGSFFSVAEQFNRELTFVAAFKTAQGMTVDQMREAGKRAGVPVEDAYTFAKLIVEDTQFIYNRGNRPNWGRGVGAPLLTFKTFSISYIELLKRMPPKQRLIALGLLALAAGANGLPFADDLDDIFDTIMQTLGYDSNIKQAKRALAYKAFGKTFGDFVLNGVSAGLPLDVSSRIGAANLIPGTATFKQSNTGIGDDILEWFGAPGGLARQIVNTISNAQDGRYASTITAASPLFAQNIVKGATMYATGEYRSMAGKKVADVDKMDAIIKGLGFNPSTVADVNRLDREIRQNVDLVKNTQSSITRKIIQAIVENDADARIDAYTELRDWNRRNPDSPIRILPATIQRGVKNAKLDLQQRSIKSASPTIRGGVRQEWMQ